jgi:aspartate kinase
MEVDGTIDKLLQAGRAAEEPGNRMYAGIVEAIRVEHIMAAERTLQNPERFAKFTTEVNEDCADLMRILNSVQHLGEVSSRTEDMIVSKGEKLNSRYVAALLNEQGTSAHFVDLSRIIDIDRQETGGRREFYEELTQVLRGKVETSGAKVPVLTGYFGNMSGGLLSSVGRGYTDLCAALVAVAIKAKELQIWGTIEGVFTADPGKVLSSISIPTITTSEAAELIFYGYEIIHPCALEQAIRSSIAIRIRNVMIPQNAGTIIIPDSWSVIDKYSFLGQLEQLSSHSLSHRPQSQGVRHPTAVTVKHDILVLSIYSNDYSEPQNFLMDVFVILRKWRLSVNLVSSSYVQVSVALHYDPAQFSSVGKDEFKIQDEDLQEAMHELSMLGTVDIASDMAIVSLVGKQMRSMDGISGRFLSALGQNNINVTMISQGTSYLLATSFVG